MSKHRLLSFQVQLPFLQTLHEVTKPRLSKSHVWLTQHDYGGCCFPKCSSHLSKDKKCGESKYTGLAVNLLPKLIIPWRMTTAVHDFPERVEIWPNSCPFTPYQLLQILFQKLPKARLSNIPGELVFWVQAECTTSSIRYMKKNPKQTKISAKFSSLGNWSSKDSRIWMLEIYDVLKADIL